MDHINFVNRIDELLIEQGINRAKLLRETELAEGFIFRIEQLKKKKTLLPKIGRLKAEGFTVVCVISISH